jgi:nucleotide-binding universal stress UspA family protein
VAARAALRWAATQARLCGARLHAVTAWELPAYRGWAPDDAFDKDLGAGAGTVLSTTVREVLGDDLGGLSVAETVVAGDPAQVLIDASTVAALLVVGRGGHGTFAEALLGSVGQQCVHHAHCPVVVVRGEAFVP